jgi:hypothetical protein
MTVVSTIRDAVPLVLATGSGPCGMDRSRFRCFSDVIRGVCGQQATTGLPDAKERLVAYLGATRDGLGRE